MAHPNSSRVIGGIEKPRFLIVGDELSPNISFEEGLTGVGGSAGAYSRVFDSSTPFLDYILKVEDDSITVREYVEITIETGEAIAEKRFIVYAYIRSNAADGDAFVHCVFQGISGTHEKEFTVDQDWKRMIVHEIVVPAGAAGTQLVYRIYPTGKAAGVAGTGAIRIDDFHARRVLSEYTLPLPDRGNQNEDFPEVLQAKHRLANMAWKKYRLGYDYIYEAGYDQLSASEEFVRTQLAHTEHEILFFPHLDSSNCYLVKWDKEFNREWAFGTAALGHKGDVFLRGQEIIYILPTDIIDALSEYNYEEDIFYGGGEGYE